MSFYYRILKKDYSNKKRFAKAAGKPLSFNKGFRPIYNNRIVEDYYYDENIDLIFSYLYSFYIQKDFCLRYMELGYKDPCLNYCLSKSGYFKSDLHKSIILDNWEDIFTSAFYKFFRKSIKMYDPDIGVQFSTFFNNTFPICFYYEFLEYIRKDKLDKNNLINEMLDYIEESEDPYYDDINTIHPISIEFLLRLSRVN